MNFLEFYVSNSERTYINLDNVLFVRPDEKGARLYFTSKDYITVHEPYGEVVLRILARRPIGVNTYAECRG